MLACIGARSESAHGYAALLIGTFLEGETILVIAGFAAHRGYLSLLWVIVVAFVGSVSGDQLWFYVGRRNGRPFMSRQPHWESRAARVQQMLSKYDWPVVLGFRFLYGLRTITPFVLGASGYRPLRFAVLNTAGAAIWSVAVAFGGFVFGHALELLLEDLKRYELRLLGLMVAAAIVLWAWRCFVVADGMALGTVEPHRADAALVAASAAAARSRGLSAAPRTDCSGLAPCAGTSLSRIGLSRAADS